MMLKSLSTCEHSRWLLPPLGPAMCQGHSQQEGQGMHQASTEIWGFIFAHRALKQNKLNFPLFHCIPAFIGMQWKKINSSLMVKAEADSQK